jgi:hypothetical protein
MGVFIRCLLICFIILVSNTPTAICQNSTFIEIPKNLQLYPRESDDSATVTISGVFNDLRFDSIYVSIFRNNVFLSRKAIAPRFNIPFAFSPRIKAELSEYKFIIGVKNNTTDSIIATRDSIVCGDVYFIAGQSNSIFGSPSETYKSEYIRTFGFNWSQDLGDTSWAVATANSFGGGPEIGAWGLRLARKIQEAHNIPVSVINGGVGGTIIEYHQRNDNDPLDMRTIYASMLYRAQKSQLTKAAKALFWYQGESNTITNYYTNFKNLYDDWLSDYPNLKKIYVIQFRPGCVESTNSPLRDLLRTLPDSLPRIVTHSTMSIPDHDGCHFALSGYHILGDQLFGLVNRDFYGSVDTIGIYSPNIAKAFFANNKRDVVGLLFNSYGAEIKVPNDTIISSIHASIKDYLYIGDDTGLVSDILVNKDTLWLKLSKPTEATYITYLPDRYYHNTETAYVGPWLTNSRGIGAFSFWRVPIKDSTTATNPPFKEKPIGGFQLYPNPSYSSATIQFSLDKRTHVRISIFDEAGRKVIRTVDEKREAGTYSIGIDTRQLGATSATVRLELDESIYDKQLIIVH